MKHRRGTVPRNASSTDCDTRRLLACHKSPAGYNPPHRIRLLASASGRATPMPRMRPPVRIGHVYIDASDRRVGRCTRIGRPYFPAPLLAPRLRLLELQCHPRTFSHCNVTVTLRQSKTDQELQCHLRTFSHCNDDIVTNRAINKKVTMSSTYFQPLQPRLASSQM